VASAFALALGPAAAVATGMTSSTTPTTTTSTTPTTTTPTPTATDNASDRAALQDYHTYLVALIKNEATGTQRDIAFTVKVRKRCSGVLTALSTLPTARVSSTALSDLGEEIGGDLALAYLSEASRPFAQLSTALYSLPWNEAAPAEAVNGLLRAESAVLGLSMSSLCADAQALANHPRVVPAGTQAFLTPYLTASARLKQQLTAFLSVLSHDATTHENQLIASIDQLVSKFAANSAIVEHTDANTILQTVGLTG
jgi:hypothetical protein